MYKNSVVISSKLGVHVRIAAQIVHKADMLKSKYNVSLYVKKKTEQEPIAISMLVLLSLKIKQGDIIEICCMDNSIEGKNAVLELCDYINMILRDETSTASKIDDIIEETNIANEQILESVPVGIVVVDANSSIVMLNNYGLKLIGRTYGEVIGRHISDVMPTSDLQAVIEQKQHQMGNILHFSDRVLIVNKSPIFSGDRVIGAVGVFQDISELEGVKELNEKFRKILGASGDLICFVDENGKISYMNPAYQEYLPESSSNSLGKDLLDVSPSGLRIKVFNSRERVENVVCQKEGIDMVSTVEPLFIDGDFKGIISISRPVNQIKNLLKKLEESEEELNYYKEELLRHRKLNNSFKEIIGSSGSLKDCLIIAEKAARSTSTVLIRGESGTGKELIAKAVHNDSDRKDKPFIRVNCAAIPENLLESELFGYEKGAFTGAVKSKPGKFAMANGGTIFLDEIGDMPRSMQAKLLRVLQEREFESVGGVVTQSVDVRVMAATNKNLEGMIVSGEFREDLYYRLNVIAIFLPPLRQRKEDISLLSEYFIKKINRKLNKRVEGIDNESLMCLQRYNWPGNIRELENIIERAINMCDGRIITSRDLPLYLSNASEDKNGLINLINGELLTLEEYEKELIKIAMSKYKSYNRAGKALGLTHRTISLKCQKYGILNETNTGE